jgi:hypothetical protein
MTTTEDGDHGRTPTDAINGPSKRTECNYCPANKHCPDGLTTTSVQRHERPAKHDSGADFR